MAKQAQKEFGKQPTLRTIELLTGVEVHLGDADASIKNYRTEFVNDEGKNPVKVVIRRTPSPKSLMFYMTFRGYYKNLGL